MVLKRGIKELVAAAEAEITTLTTDDAIKRHGDKNLIFVDIRDIRELERDGVIENAIHAPRGMIEFWFDPESPYHREVFGDEKKTYVLYCTSAWRSALATHALQSMGFSNVVQFSSGLNGWKKAGGPVIEYEKKISK
ncbi:MAG: rhodanese [Rhodospirillaceae bacterium TMED8]|nr:MAG: rhodanese [Rhodospirillaceae bacterium TMED8]